ncbi:MAG TPA: hypothetical protein VMI13_00975 [Solirubrobacteraceae bacterium]|nr:hypothetical protein [Solirubrobacteraceae bacterium]
MSRNTDTLRQAFDTINAFYRDELTSEALGQGFDPQFQMIWRDRQTYPDFPQQLGGTQEFIAFAEQYQERWMNLVQELLEVIDAPGNRVLAVVRQRGQGRQSGVPIVIHFFELCSFQDAKVSSIEFFRHRADALQAAGLEE